MKATSRILNVMLIASAMALAACGGQAHAEQRSLSGQVILNATETVDISRAIYIDINPSASVVIDQNGGVHNGAFATPEDLTGSTYVQQFYNVPGTTSYYNMTQVSTVVCQNGTASVINWLTRPAQVVNDNCAFANGVRAYSRR